MRDLDTFPTLTKTADAGLKRMLIGSTAEYVVRHADCPALIVPSHDRPVLTSTKN